MPTEKLLMTVAVTVVPGSCPISESEAAPPAAPLIGLMGLFSPSVAKAEVAMIAAVNVDTASVRRLFKKRIRTTPEKLCAA